MNARVWEDGDVEEVEMSMSLSWCCSSGNSSNSKWKWKWRRFRLPSMAESWKERVLVLVLCPAPSVPFAPREIAIALHHRLAALPHLSLVVVLLLSSRLTTSSHLLPLHPLHTHTHPTPTPSTDTQPTLPIANARTFNASRPHTRR